MNEKFGFLSNFAGVKLKKKSPLYPTPTKGELTDNPPIRNRQSLLTDDDSEEEERAKPSRMTQEKPVRNRILESSASSQLFDDDPDRTYCSELENEVVPAINPALNPPKVSSRPRLADTVVGSFSDDELCSELSGMKVAEKKIEKRVREPLRETVEGAFSDVDESVEEQNPPPPVVSKAKLADTVVYSQSEDEDDEDEVLIHKQQKPQVRKASLPDTIIGFTESMSELTINRDFKPPSVVEEESEDDSGSEEIIVVSDSEDEVEEEEEPPTADSYLNCSSVRSSDPKPDSDTTLNKFFNNPPIISDPDRVVNHSVIRQVKCVPEVQEKSSPDRFKVQEEIDEVENSIEIPETPPKSSSESQQVIPSKNIQTPTLQNSSSTISVRTPKINFSAKINIEFKISMRDSSSTESSSGSSPQSCSSSSSNPPTPPPAEKNTPVRQEKFAKSNPSDDFHTPTKQPENPVDIDEDLQKILDNLYGETWKTPQLLKSCKSKTVRQDLRKSIAANNFENFVKNLPRDLESTRINRLSGEDMVKEFVTPSNPVKATAKKKTASSVKKTPSQSSKNTEESRRRAVKTPKYFDFCDTDTESEDDSDDEFNPKQKDDEILNDTWNASSDSDYEDDAARIRKSILTRKSRRGEELVFVPETPAEVKQKRLDDLLDRYEYTKPPAMPSTDTPRKPSKRKLFTHSHFEDEINFDTTNSDEEVKKTAEKENDGDVVNIDMTGMFFPKKDVKTKTPVVKKTPKPKPQTPKPQVLSNAGGYSFLKSLDVDMNPAMCNSEALHYRTNYRTKKAELTEKLFKLYDEKVFDGELKDVPVKWNKKLLNTAGRCNNSRRNGVKRSELELSEKVLTSADRLRCTLIHEMCHAATWILNGENGHGATWKRWAAKANSIFPELPKINVCHSYTIEYRYTYQCTDCKAKYQAHSKSKKVENIRCSVCKGSIELFLNKKTKDGTGVVMTPVSKDIKGFPKFVKLKYKEVKQPNMTHKEVMQLLSQKFGSLSVEEKQNL